jgi:hypothetical protein
MAEKTTHKYDKYFIEYDPERWPEERRPVIARLQDDVVAGSDFYLVHWVMPDVPVPHYAYAGHPPHIHKDAELLFHIGMNPDDPTDLGGVVDFYMGPELERHVITKSTVVFIPPNCIHAPWIPLKTYRPWIFIEINQGPAHTEKFYQQLLPKDIRDKIPWQHWQDEGY